MSAAPEPELTAELIAWLKGEFPPRCYDATEPLERHLQYAGQVKLVEWLEERYTAQQKAGEDTAAIVALYTEDGDEEAHVIFNRERLGDTEN